MPTLFDTRRMRAALKAARPVRRQMPRALRHHLARSRMLARNVTSVDSIRTWFRSFFSVLRVQGSMRRFSLRMLPRPPVMSLRGMALLPVRSMSAGMYAARRPRRMAASSMDWFAFAVR